MRTNILGFLGGILFLFSTGVVNASGLVLEGGLHFGGDRFATVYTTTGTTDINAGELYSFGIGVSLDLAPDVESRITIGIKEDGVFASNGSVKFSRYPIDVLVLKRAGGWKIGGGVTYHMNPEYYDSTYPPLSVPFDDALGLLVELDRELGAVYIGGRLTFIDYQIAGGSGKFSGNSFGVVAGIKF
jgi:hypothetical protein